MFSYDPLTSNNSKSKMIPRDTLPHGSISRDTMYRGSLSRDNKPHGSMSRDRIPHGSISHDNIPHASKSRDSIQHGSWSHGTKSHGTLSSCDLDETGHSLEHVLQWPGKYKDIQIGLRLMEIKQLRHLTDNMKEELLKFQTRVHHTNLLRFFALTDIENSMYVIGDYCPRGTVKDMLNDRKFNLSNELKYSVAIDVASGMSYLHEIEYVHGFLRCSVCVIDSRWQVKVTDWEYVRLLSIYKPDLSPLVQVIANDDTSYTGNLKTNRGLWMAPEILKSRYLEFPTKNSDVFSFSMVLQELFTRENPYVNVTSFEISSVTEIEERIIYNNLRPAHAEETPIDMRQIIELCWNDNPSSRPSFPQVIKLLRRTKYGHRNVIEAMMSSMEECIRDLEERIDEQESELSILHAILKQKVNNCNASETTM